MSRDRKALPWLLVAFALMIPTAQPVVKGLAAEADRPNSGPIPEQPVDGMAAVRPWNPQDAAILGKPTVERLNPDGRRRGARSMVPVLAADVCPPTDGESPTT